MIPQRPYAPACARNQHALGETLRRYLPRHCTLLEIGSGTGQHAAFLAAQNPGWRWQCSDLAENLPGIAQWLEDLPPARRLDPIVLDVSRDSWPAGPYQVVFTANTLHIMPWSAVRLLFAGLGHTLAKGGLFAAYGPFNYAGQFTSPSNAEFDRWLKDRAAHQGIRDFAAVDALAQGAGCELLGDEAMPANNRLLIWRKTG